MSALVEFTPEESFFNDEYLESDMHQQLVSGDRLTRFHSLRSDLRYFGAKTLRVSYERKARVFDTWPEDRGWEKIVTVKATRWPLKSKISYEVVLPVLASERWSAIIASRQYELVKPDKCRLSEIENPEATLRYGGSVTLPAIYWNRYALEDIVKERQRLVALGYFQLHELPPTIDMIKTVLAFFAQIRRGEVDFKRPIMVTPQAQLESGGIVDQGDKQQLRLF